MITCPASVNSDCRWPRRRYASPRVMPFHSFLFMLVILLAGVFPARHATNDEYDWFNRLVSHVAMYEIAQTIQVEPLALVGDE